MKYTFITILHNLEFESVKNKGVEFFSRARFSNRTGVIQKLLNSDLVKYNVGVHSVDEFEGVVYCYVKNEIEYIKTKEDMDQVGSNLTFHLLRIVQSFLTELWEVKDNNIYVRDGFLIAYENDIENGFTYKASLSAIFSKSTLCNDKTLYKDSELNVAIEKFKKNEKENLFNENTDYKIPTDEVFFKNKKSTRIDRAHYFVLSARGSSIFPMKIVYYCTALECLFSTAKTEMNYRIAERVALMLGNNKSDKRKYFDLIKKTYDVRSTIVHGSSLKGNSEELKNISEDLDQALRELLTTQNDIFDKEEKDMEKYFLDLVFDNKFKGD
ncbi:HEPN domain-containing protein [Saccharibacillus sp. JS10]|uniref:HEPN domain-containing protein n=1 Tax=Saccharibacillus sp. JS10 TaxID=2950552 RepID=UPI002109FC1E|nr:HEPN domain-containing protein [Saccharibacillus sp. JS10]MCQ4088446.1 HEPN domain-containing protein [Saccharibacillus sp. JS10]